MRRIATIVAFTVLLTARARAGTLDGNLIEYGMGGFADGGYGPPMLYPPEVKIYTDRRIVFGDKDGIWQGMLAPRRLEELKSDLANNPLLKSTRLIPVRNGGLISLHGGVAYIRYRDGDDEIVIAVLSHPHHGDYVRLLHRIRAEIPNEYSSFRPKSLSVGLYRGRAWRDPVAWTFSSIRLAGSDSINVTDPAAIALIIDHSFGGFSWLQTNVQEDGVDYELILQSVPGWFEPQELGTTLEMLHMSAD